MTDTNTRLCVLLPCASGEHWALPQNCLAEILTVPESIATPPPQLSWRGRQVPVLDPGAQQSASWRDDGGGTGLVAVLLGLQGRGCDYWGVAVRGQGLAVRNIADEEIEDAPEEALGHARTAFRLAGTLYQVPDLEALQGAMSR